MINPYHEAPERLFLWDPDSDQRQVRIVPRASSGHAKWRAQTSIATLGLNREELLNVRWIEYQKVSLLCRVYLSNNLPPALQLETETVLRDAIRPEQFFAAMCRWTIREQFGLNL